MQTEDSRDASIQGQEGDEDTEHMSALSLNSPWAWFYYSTFGVQLVGVTIYAILRHADAVPSATPFGIYAAILPEVSDGLPAVAAYSLLIAVTVEVIRMIAERYLAKRFKQGKDEGIVIGEERATARLLDMLDEDTRKEVERKLRHNGRSNGSSHS